MDKLKYKLVLLVDDDMRNTFALRSYLNSMDMEVQVVENGEDALALLKKDPKPDIILVDMMMPVMDGYELLQQLRNNEILSKIPVIAVTAKAMKGDREKCLDAGAWDYLSKPIDISLLKEKLNQLIQ